MSPEIDLSMEIQYATNKVYQINGKRWIIKKKHLIFKNIYI